MESVETWVTTIDNPFDPFLDRENWKRFDEDHGYFTTELIARVAMPSDELDDDAYNGVVEEAVDEIVRFNVLGIYKKAIKGEDNVSTEENRRKAEAFMQKLRSTE